MFEKMPSLVEFKFVHVYMIGYVGNLVSFIAGFLAEYIWPDKIPRDLTNLTIWTTPRRKSSF